MSWWQIALAVLVTLAAGIPLGVVMARLEKRLAGQRRGKLPEKAKTEELPPALSDEIRENLQVANRPWTAGIAPFKTSAWEACQGRLPVSLQDSLAPIYADIKMANSLVWLSEGLGRKSENVNVNYLRLRNQVATGLARSLTTPVQRVPAALTAERQAAEPCAVQE